MQKRAVHMKQFFFGLLACAAVALPALGDEIVDPDTMGLGLQTREAAPPTPSHDPSLCLDSMVTEPWTDDLEPQPSAMDANCSVPELPIAT
jgi:hypothetical protein